MKTVLQAFVDQVIANSRFDELDRIYLNNRIMSLVGEEGMTAEAKSSELIALKEQLVAIAYHNGKVGGSFAEQDCLGTSLMDFITPSPSQVNHDFWKTYESSPKQAIADFYQLSKRNDYIKTKAIAKNIAYSTKTAYGDLEITINLSKPEKDPKAIAKARELPQSDYPKCQLCMENEGYQGRINHPARANHRIIRFDLEGETWGFQYSPYAYFNEHAIFLCVKHTPMQISQVTFERLLAIVERFPDYFAGSNADLPIVGGSILTHEHYQGGRHTFPMEKAEIEHSFVVKGFDKVEAGVVKWPMTVIRLKSRQKEEIIALATKIFLAWQSYSDESVGVLARSHGESHHTVTPIARKKGDVFELDLVLRDNQTSEQYPDGIYHPHPDVQHIKKENIGLIEVMGLAILPPRLKEELEEVEKYLLDEPHQMADYHREWAKAIKEAHPDVTRDKVAELVHEAVGLVFARVLEDAGVYKRDTKGQKALLRFIDSLGLE